MAVGSGPIRIEDNQVEVPDREATGTDERDARAQGRLVDGVGGG